MSKAGISFEEMKADMMKDEEFKAEYEKLKFRYEAIEQIIKMPFPQESKKRFFPKFVDCFCGL
ncbi:MAG: hypothetical protein NC417_01540 [Candidatus Gastranaerophilales bacterium]|nr:hypothetical protein [Candidatus Gastranaerophilales bacterium]